MINDPLNFLHSMCVYAVTAAAALSPAVAVSYAPVGSQPWNLWLNDAAEDSTDSICADPYAVVRIYGGKPEAENPKGIIAVQLAAFGSSNIQAHYLANALFRALCKDAFELPRRMVPIAGYNVADNSADALGNWMLVSAGVQTAPGAAGRDDRGRVKIVSNFDLSYYRAGQS